MTEFDVYDLIRETRRANAQVVNPRHLAALVLSYLPEEHALDAVRQLLPLAIQNDITRYRNVTGTGDQAPTGDHTSGVPGATPFRPSSFQARHHEQWRARLDENLGVGNTAAHKPLRDFLLTDVQVTAMWHETLALRNALRGEDYRKLEAAMQEYDATTVGALPEAVLREVLSR